MKKVAVVVYMLSSMYMLNAMDQDFPRKKENSTVPIARCCYFKAVVPPCLNCVKNRNIDPDDKEQCLKAIKLFSRSQEVKRCP